MIRAYGSQIVSGDGRLINLSLQHDSSLRLSMTASQKSVNYL